MKRFKKASAVATELIRNIPGRNKKIFKTDVVLKSLLKLKINLEKTSDNITQKTQKTDIPKENTEEINNEDNSNLESESEDE